jgi:tetratricopeptide (TPR) repeat protein
VLYLSDIQAVDMAPPAAVTQSKKAAPAEKISLLEPVLKVYAGLPADWVLDAMGDLADAYDAQGQGQKSAAVYAQINQLYPNSPYQKEALVGEAKTDLQAGKIDDALATIKPLIDQANQNIAPSPADGRLFASAFLVYGQALQQQKQYAQALEAFLTVKTMFYQSPALVDQADQLAQALQKQNPDVSVD